MPNWWENNPNLPRPSEDQWGKKDPTTGITWSRSGVPLSGVPTEILHANEPTVAARAAEYAATGPGTFSEFAQQFTLDNRGRVEGTSWTPWELWHMDRDPTTGSPFMDPESVKGTPESPEYTDPGDYKTTDEFRTLKSGFLGAMLEIGLDQETINSLWTWVEGRFIEDPSFGAAQAQIEMYEQEAFKKRFPGITAMREDDARRDIPTPGEYLLRERTWVTYLERYGMSALGADLDQLVAEAYMQSIGDGEFVERLAAASEMINKVPEAVKEVFGDWYGPVGAQAIMAAFLDPNDEVFGGEWKNWTTLQGEVSSARVGGWSKMKLGLDAPITKDRAIAIAGLGDLTSKTWDKFSTLKDRENLFIERLGETDLDMLTHGIAAEFGVGEESVGGELLSATELSNLIEGRRQRRMADFSGGGGALLTGTTTGYGAANA